MRADQFATNPSNIPIEQDTTKDPIELAFEQSVMSMGEFVKPADIKRAPSKEQLRRKRVHKYIRRIVGVAFCVLMAPIPVSCMGGLYAEEAAADCPPVPEQPVADEDSNLNQARDIVANMNFGIEKDTYDKLKVRIDEATTIDEIEALIQEPMTQFNMKVMFGEVPGKKYGLIPMSDPNRTHRPELITIEEAKKSSNNFLLGLSKIPSSFLYQLEGTNLYFTHSPANGPNDDHPDGGVYVDSWDSYGRNIILNTASEEIGDAFGHEVMHGLHKVQCGTTGTKQGKGDNIFVSFNDGRQYDSDPTLKEAAKEEGITITAYAASSYTEDYAETGASLITGDYDFQRYILHPPVADKQRLVAQRLSLIEPGFEEYAAYMGYIGNQAFPKEFAKAYSYTVECFGSLVINNKSMAGVSFEPVLIEVNKNALTDDSQAENYLVYRQTEPATPGEQPDVYKIGWDATPGDYDEYERQSLLGSSILLYQQTQNEASASTVEFTMPEGNSKLFGGHVVRCSTFTPTTELTTE